MSNSLATKLKSSRLEVIVLVVAAVCYLALSALVRDGWADTHMDTWLPVPTISPRSPLGQILQTFSVITQPYVMLVVTAVLAVRAFHQRQRRLGFALLVALLGLPIWEVARHLVERPRPQSAFSESISATGYAYPAGHTLAMTLLAWVFVAVSSAQLRSVGTLRRWQFWGVVAVLVVAVDQFLMGVQYLSDLVAGVLLGLTMATVSLLVSRFEGILPGGTVTSRLPSSGRHPGVIYNPTKVLDLEDFRRRLTTVSRYKGWEAPTWWETKADDPGAGMAADAADQGMDRVLVAGGDGTVRAVCTAMAGHEIPVAIVPAGTGNLLGRNLRIPLDEGEATALALQGFPRRIDVVRFTSGEAANTFVVMAGVGLDAQIMRDTNPKIKKMVKGGAYVLAGAQQVSNAEFHATVTLDGKVVHDGDAAMVLVGNVGKLQGGIDLIPGADASDGLLHVVVAQGQGVLGMGRMLKALSKGKDSAAIRHYDGRRVTVELDRPVPYQLDGDVEGDTRSFEAEIDPGALSVVVPR
ncbi:bifunctional phosphatase PAP2/diacylglycerol kinase family protein [Demequina aurantiaca]|uniref:bifunctional phosphatase PAP2/diacylglycerol kinase family protein n=1 Tax=Demequina aurantiaca TaxID=676200 RepID=UPI0007831EE6|nr:diacylglycerol kinase family protein [Demequina aurantiaca]